MKLILLILIILSSYALMTFFLTLKISNKEIRERKAQLNKGEFACMLQLQKLSKEQYTILPDIMIKLENSTTQIDFIVVSQYGLFVIEVKENNGFIIANEKSEFWKTYYGYGKNHFLFYNPILQNNIHIDMLSNLLNLDKNKIFSIICFSNINNLKFNGGNCSECIIDINQISSEIVKYSKNVLSSEEISEIVNKIESNNITDEKIRNEHVNRIKQKKANRNECINKMICPNCQSKLEVKQGQYGCFLSCSNYPSCKFSMNINDAYEISKKSLI